jgi:hypothetical protein
MWSSESHVGRMYREFWGSHRETRALGQVLEALEAKC